MTIRIQTAQTTSQALDVVRLRYEVYVEELGRTQTHADHRERTIREPLDEHALMWVAYEGERLVGSVRVNYADEGDLGDYPALYEMARMGTLHPKRTSITTKLVVAREYRNSALAYRLAMAGYRGMLEDGILHDFIDVFPERIPFFERLGYRIHVPAAHHPEYGSVVVMTLSVRDAVHLERVGSPFSRYFTRKAAVA